MINGVERESPAFAFYERHKSVFGDLSIDFRDPHGGIGGFGASSAQFTTLYKLYLYLTQQKFDLKSFLDVYRTCSKKKDEHAIPPSGADCLVQYQNQHIFFNSSSQHIKNVQWNFVGASFSIFRTKLKIATHSHLRQLNPINQRNVCELDEFVKKVEQSFSTNDVNLLVLNTQKFFEKLEDLGLVVKDTSESVEAFLNTDGVLAAKGCGAMSADTIIVIHKTEKLANVLETAKKTHLTYVNGA
jgi:mevalonate kinase